jgi:hypothetical protein
VGDRDKRDVGCEKEGMLTENKSTAVQSFTMLQHDSEPLEETVILGAFT